MANDSSFDVVSRLDRQEVDNAVNQCAKEISQRYDFRGVDASVSLSGDTITLEANTAERVLAILDVLESKLFRRGVSLKALDLGDKEPRPSGKIYRLACPLREGLTQEVAKKITKAIRDEGPKSVKATIQGDEVRATSKSRHDPHTAIAPLKHLDAAPPPDPAPAAPDSATTEPVLKSMPPVKITMLAPIPINAIVEVCKPMVNTLFKVKKYSLLIVNAIINRINPASDASLRNISFCFSFISYLLSFSSEHIFYACRILHNFFLIGFFRFKKCGHFSLTHDDNAIGHA